MEVCIKIENPNDSELELIGKLTELDIEKKFQAQKLMEEKILTSIPSMFQKMMMDKDKIICENKDKIICEDKEVNLRKDK